MLSALTSSRQLRYARRKGPNQPDPRHVELNGHVAVRTLLARHSDIVPVGAVGTANLRAKG